MSGQGDHVSVPTTRRAVDAASSMLSTKNGEQARKRYLFGTFLMLCVVFLWVSSSFIMNTMFTSMSYNKPFLITYLCTATFTLYLVRPLYELAKLRRQNRNSSGAAAAVAPFKPLDPSALGDSLYVDEEGVVFPRSSFVSTRARSRRSLSRSMSRSRVGVTPIETEVVTAVVEEPPLTVYQTAALALVFCGLWFSANWAMNAALGYTSVSSTTILSSMSGFFTLMLGATVGVEKFSKAKLASVVLSVLGVVIVSLSDRAIDHPSRSSPHPEPAPSLPTHPVLGDFLALLSAVAYALYVILLKVRVKTEARISMTLFFGFVGAWNIILLWPLGFLLHFTGIETWELPHGRALWAGIAVNSAITFVSDAVYLKAMLLTSPLAVTLGISLTIPLAMVGDLVRGTQLGGWTLYFGGALVLVSFVVNGVLDLDNVIEDATGADSLAQAPSSSSSPLSAERDHGEAEGLLQDSSSS